MLGQEFEAEGLGLYKGIGRPHLSHLRSRRPVLLRAGREAKSGTGVSPTRLSALGHEYWRAIFLGNMNVKLRHRPFGTGVFWRVFRFARSTLVLAK